MSNRLSERLALHIAYRIAHSYQNAKPPCTPGALAQQLNVPTLAVERLLEEFERRGLICPTADEPAGYLPTRPIDQISVLDIIHATRERGEHDQINADALPADATVDQTVDLMERALDQAMQGMTLKDLAAAEFPRSLKDIDESGERPREAGLG